MAAEETTSSSGNISNNFNAGQGGLNMDQTLAQIPKGKLTYALNAAVENFDSSSINYQNEQGNEPCYTNGNFFPEDYTVIGNHFIPEKNKHIFFLANPNTAESQIGYMENNDCVYRVLLSDPCLAFNVTFPIHKVVHRITNCTTEIYWTDALNPRRYLNIDNVPKTDICNKLKIQPNFTIPQLDVIDVINGGELIAGTYQFAIQYCDELGFGYTSYYSVTNPTSIANNQVTTPDFNYPVNRSIRLNISNLETTGYFDYYNLAVIKTINGVESVELIGTYYIDAASTQYTYSGQNQTQIRLSLNDIFEKFPYYDVANDVTSVQDVLVWDGLTSNDRVNYQSIASQIALKWQTYKLPATESYANEINTAELRGYLRDEVYAFEIVFLLKNGRQTDGFHIPGRAAISSDLVVINKASNNDYIGIGTSAPTWKIYNTGSVTGTATGNPINNATPYQYGEFAYWESEDKYPANTLVWGSLTGQKIRHHKFPDVLVSPIFESAAFVSGQPVMQTADAVYPIGVRIDTAQVQALINASSLTAQQKADIAGFKIVRANRNTNKSIVGKGILRNVGKFNREGTDYYFPNYPYNDLAQDPFLLEKNNAFSGQSTYYKLDVINLSTIQYTDSSTGELTSKIFDKGISYLCSVTPPILLNGRTTITDPVAQYNAKFYQLTSNSSTNFLYQDPLNYPANTPITVTSSTPVVIASATTPRFTGGDTRYTIAFSESANPYCQPANLNAFSTNESKFRMVFNSPETSFGQPTLGNILKLENALIGAGRAHFVQVKNNARYKFLNTLAQQIALKSSYDLATVVGNTLDANAMFTVYQSYLTIYINGITRKNFAYSFNSIASYDYWKNVTNSGNKQRELDAYQYVIPGIQSVSDTYDLNNFQRESSVYLKTAGTTPLPFVKDVPAVSSTGLVDNSRFTISQRGNCASPEMLEDITSILYYGSLKNIIANQYGQIYTYQTIDTGFQVDFDLLPGIATVFGGDTFISRFAFKTKLPFFIDNRVGAPDDSDIFYDEIGNVAYPKYWHSSRSILSNYQAGTTNLQNIISVKAVSLDCSQGVGYISTSGTTTTTTTAAPNTVTAGSLAYGYDGKFYMFAYGIPYFYCESSINTDLRQATNNQEGDFYPHVSSGIPDSWLQQTFVPIAFDNTYSYNVTYSRQNTDNFFSHLPENWSNNQCNTVFPFRAIYSDAQVSDPTSTVNNWLIYRPISFFDFPQSYGDLTSLDGIQNKAVLARFENKSLLYNTMLTINTSNPQAAYLGNDTLFRSSPPIDFAETDLGYVGSQNKMLLKIPEGQVTIDAKRGQIFLVSGNQVTDLTGFGSGVQRFMTDHLAFEILRYFPEADTDNHFNGLGLHGVYDSKFDRIIVTKLDYIPQPDWTRSMYYGTDPSSPYTYKKFYIINCGQELVVQLTDPTYFCNKSWTMSFNFNTKSWISFHTYLPNYYIGENNFFYSGLNEGCNMTLFAAVATTAGCLLPSGSAIVNNCLPGNNCALPSGTVFIIPPTTTTTTSAPIYNCALPSGTVVINPSTTTTTTTANTSTTTTTTSSTTSTTTTAAVLTTTTTTTPVPGTTTTTTTFILTTTTTTTEVPTTTTTTTIPGTTTTTTTIPNTTTTTTTETPFYYYTGPLYLCPDCIPLGFNAIMKSNTPVTLGNGVYYKFNKAKDTFLPTSITSGPDYDFDLQTDSYYTSTNCTQSCNGPTTTTTTTIAPPTTTTTTTAVVYKTFTFNPNVNSLSNVCPFTTYPTTWYFLGTGAYPTTGDSIYGQPSPPAYQLNGWVKLSNGHAIFGDGSNVIINDVVCSSLTTTTTTTEDPGAYWNAQWCTGMGTPSILRVPSSAISGQVIFSGDTLDTCATLTTPYVGTPSSYVDRRTYPLYSNCTACNGLVNHRWATMVRCDNPSIIAYSNWFNVGDFNINDIVTQDPTFSSPPYYTYRITGISTNSSNFPQFVIQATGLSTCPQSTTTTTTTIAPITTTTTTTPPPNYKYYFQLVDLTNPPSGLGGGSMTLNSTGGSATFTTDYNLVLLANQYNPSGSIVTADSGKRIQKVERLSYTGSVAASQNVAASSYTFTTGPFIMSSTGVNAGQFETIKVYIEAAPATTTTTTTASIPLNFTLTQICDTSTTSPYIRISNFSGSSTGFIYPGATTYSSEAAALNGAFIPTNIPPSGTLDYTNPGGLSPGTYWIAIQDSGIPSRKIAKSIVIASCATTTTTTTVIPITTTTTTTTAIPIYYYLVYDLTVNCEPVGGVAYQSTSSYTVDRYVTVNGGSIAKYITVNNAPTSGINLTSVATSSCVVPTTTTTTTVAPPTRYRYELYNLDANCNLLFPAILAWSFQSVSTGYYSINELPVSYLIVASHTDDTQQLVNIVSSSCVAPTTTTTTTATPPPTPIPQSILVEASNNIGPDQSCLGTNYSTTVETATVTLYDQFGNVINAPTTITVTVNTTYNLCSGGSITAPINIVISEGTSSGSTSWDSTRTVDCNGECLSESRYYDCALSNTASLAWKSGTVSC